MWMADALRNGPFERDIEQAIVALKKGACLLKYGRRGKPKFCPFRLSIDEAVLIWHSRRRERQLKLSNVSKLIPGQRTAIFQRYPRPDKEYQSFSLIYGDRSLDLICKDKEEAEVWFVGLKALISSGTHRKRLESTGDGIIDINANPHAQNNSPLTLPFVNFEKDTGDTQQLQVQYENPRHNSVGDVFSDVILDTASTSSVQSDSVSNSLCLISSAGVDNSNGRNSGAETLRVSLSSAISSSSHGSGHDDFDALGDLFFWGEGIGDGVLGGGLQKVGSPFATKVDATLPKALESAVLLDVQNIACGSRHAVLVTKQGQVFSWGEESGGRLGHGLDADISHPKLIHALGGMNIELVTCGEYHTCAVTVSGDLYTWGDGVHSSGLLGHGSIASHWIPKQVTSTIEGLHVSSVSCGPWHTAFVTSSGQLFTFGDGIFGALGHGDRTAINIPREVEALKGLRTVRSACGVWHTAAIVDIAVEPTDCSNTPSGKLFTWGDGDKGRLGHGDTEPRLIPACVTTLTEPNFCKVACGHDITIALATTGRVYTMGSASYGQLGSPDADGKRPTCIEGNLCNSFIEEIACGSYHAAILTSRSEVYTWGKGTNGQLGHGDNDNRNQPTLVEALKKKQVKSVACGSNFTAIICLHKWVSTADQYICSGCRLPFGFRRKRHNCYNCGLVFCNSCSSRKSVKASLAPNIHKPYRVCDECYTKINKNIGCGIQSQIPRHQNGSQNQMSNGLAEKEIVGSRLSFIGSFIGESRHKHNSRSEPSNNRLSLTLNESSRWGRVYMSKSSNILCRSSKKMFSSSVPGSRIASRSTSPVSSMPSPPHSTIGLASPEVVVYDTKKTNDSMSQEVVRLQLQVEDLLLKSQLLEAELQGTSSQLRDVTAKAGEETAKSKAAKEVIKSLTTQLKDMAERVPQSIVVNHPGSKAVHAYGSNFLTLDLNENSDQSSESLSCSVTRRLAKETEWVEQDEPGVYITISSCTESKMDMKRIRFSRSSFNEQQAEKWLVDNWARLREQYNFSTGGKSATVPVSTSDRKETMID